VTASASKSAAVMATSYLKVGGIEIRRRFGEAAVLEQTQGAPALPTFGLERDNLLTSSALRLSPGARKWGVVVASHNRHFLVVGRGKRPAIG